MLDGNPGGAGGDAEGGPAGGDGVADAGGGIPGGGGEADGGGFPGPAESGIDALGGPRGAPLGGGGDEPEGPFFFGGAPGGGGDESDFGGGAPRGMPRGAGAPGGGGDADGGAPLWASRSERGESEAKKRLRKRCNTKHGARGREQHIITHGAASSFISYVPVQRRAGHEGGGLRLEAEGMRSAARAAAHAAFQAAHAAFQADHEPLQAEVAATS